MEYMHGGDIYTYENVTDYSVNLNPFGPGEEVLLAMAENLKHAGEYPDSKSRKLRSALAEHLQVPGISDFWKWSGRTDLFGDPFPSTEKSAPDDPVFCRISQSASGGGL